jgi:hypothetical protein
MIRAALLACALVAVPSAVLAQVQSSGSGQVRLLRAPDTAGDGPPAEYISDMAPEYNGWVYHDFPGGSGVTTTLYRGDGYPATIMVCPRATPIRLLPEGQGELEVRNNRCGTVTTDHLRVSSFGQPNSGTRPIRYRIIAVHRAAE